MGSRTGCSTTISTDRSMTSTPCPDPLQVVYLLAGVPRILLIPPLGTHRHRGAPTWFVQFHGVRLNPFGIPIDVAVGNFFGGGFDPGPGLPPPPPPPPVITKTNVPVKVNIRDLQAHPGEEGRRRRARSQRRAVSTRFCSTAWRRRGATGYKPKPVNASSRSTRRRSSRAWRRLRRNHCRATTRCSW